MFLEITTSLESNILGSLSLIQALFKIDCLFFFNRDMLTETKKLTLVQYCTID